MHGNIRLDEFKVACKALEKPLNSLLVHKVSKSAAGLGTPVGVSRIRRAGTHVNQTVTLFIGGLGTT